MKTSKIIAFLSIPVVIVFLLYFIDPPRKSVVSEENVSAPEKAPWMNGGNLPGVTWKDDIHPIFVRNKCGTCHTRNSEDIVEGFEEYALGIIDPGDPSNPNFSYHELVYNEGSVPLLDGETLRDGQCCWPRNKNMNQQRRIWIGHPERSVLVRKLARDYLDWEKPPRFLDEGLQLQWGLPMPLWLTEDHHTSQEGSEGHHGKESTSAENEHHSLAQADVMPSAHDNAVSSPTIFDKVYFKVMLWFGKGHDQLQSLPAAIPAKDIALIRYWINNTLQINEPDTTIAVEVRNREGTALPGTKVVFIGNFNSPDQLEVQDSFSVTTDKDGKALLRFPENSVVSRYWFIGLTGTNKQDYSSFSIFPGRSNKYVLIM